ncbi:MAG: helix-turn-helix transcriptional regulator [Coxiellaceae bacterium]|nr:helix-turn-helix transcriptional regulator [Coxiellaceae bacterium]
MSTKSKVTSKALKQLEKITGGPLTLAKLLWSIRMSEELTQVEFAAQLKMSKQQLCDIERGRKPVSPKLAAEYAKKLGYSEKQFIRLALQDLLDRAGLHFEVELKKAA